MRMRFSHDIKLRTLVSSGPYCKKVLIKTARLVPLIRTSLGIYDQRTLTESPISSEQCIAFLIQKSIYCYY